MADFVDENTIGSGDEGPLNDSLESLTGSVGSCVTAEEMKPVEEIKEVANGEVVDHGQTTLPVESATRSKAGQKQGHLIGNTMKNTSVKPSKEKDSISKSRTKMSYSEMYQKRLQSQKISKGKGRVSHETVRRQEVGKIESPEKQAAKDIIGEIQSEMIAVNRNEDYINQNNPVYDLHRYEHALNSGQNVAGFQRKFNSHSTRHSDNMSEGLYNSKLEWTNYINRSNASENYVSSNHNKTSNIDNSFYQATDIHQGRYSENDGPYLHMDDIYSSKYLPPIQEVPTSVRSAPADIQTNLSNHYCYDTLDNQPSLLQMEVKGEYSSHHELNNSMTSSGSLATARSAPVGCSTVPAKQLPYEPYTVGDFRKLAKQHTLAGGLGPNTNSEEHKEKMKKSIRLREYAASIRQKHHVDSNQWKKYPVPTTQAKPQKIQDANARRNKALQYARAVPKPTTTKVQPPKLKSEANRQESFTLLDVLRQRHEKERKAVDAVRKDLEAKLKTR